MMAKKKVCIGTHLPEETESHCIDPLWDGTSDTWICEASLRVAKEAWQGTNELERRLQSGDVL